MVDLGSLARRAKASGDGEAYASVAKGPAYRLGVGARASRGHEPAFFVEVVLDPFPDRPKMEPGRLRDQATIGERLRSRGYDLSCDDAGVITCERALDGTDPEEELREVARLLTEDPRRGRMLRRS